MQILQRIRSVQDPVKGEDQLLLLIQFFESSMQEIVTGIEKAGSALKNLEAIQFGLQNSLDSLSELSETTSLRLQEAMDRRSKFLDTLSHVMKSISDTAQSIEQNLK